MRRFLPQNSFLPVLCALALLAASVELSAQEKSFLWRVEAGKGTVYLLGSIHMLKREDLALKPIVDEVFNKAKRLAFEIDLLNESPEKSQKLILQRGLNLDGKLLQQKVSRETFQWATIWANELGIDIKILTPMKPWLAGLMLTVLHLQRMGYDPSLGVDRQLAKRAQAANKPVSGLETTESQFDRFDRLPANLQEMMLRYSIGEIEQVNKAVERLVKVWRDGDVAAAEQLFLAGMAQYPEIQDLLLDQRNRNWLPQIEKFLQESDDTLVVVGAAHMLGKAGVVELLRSRGYKVEQM
jgi:uncharacterized protein YbaP (TraB family)